MNHGSLLSISCGKSDGPRVATGVSRLSRAKAAISWAVCRPDHKQFNTLYNYNNTLTIWAVADE